jgi:hypothetical protein
MSIIPHFSVVFIVTPPQLGKGLNPHTLLIFKRNFMTHYFNIITLSGAPLGCVLGGTQ